MEFGKESLFCYESWELRCQSCLVVRRESLVFRSNSKDFFISLISVGGSVRFRVWWWLFIWRRVWGIWYGFGYFQFGLKSDFFFREWELIFFFFLIKGLRGFREVVVFYIGFVVFFLFQLKQRALLKLDEVRFVVF